MPLRALPPAASRLSVTVVSSPSRGDVLAHDVARGLGRVPRALPCKYFYDTRGSQLFDAICDTPEYYLTRTEQGLLDRHARELVAEIAPEELVELGSGAAHKTRALLDAMCAQGGERVYRPIEISETALVGSARRLIADYPRLRVHGLVADYERHLHRVPPGGRRLFAFLGSTLGNFTGPEAVAFLRRVGAAMRSGDGLLLGLDLVKPVRVLDAAYNDAQGITAEFNRNLLRVVNRELGGDFDPAAFAHVARYRPECRQVEMHLRSQRSQRVTLARLRRSFSIAAGEMIRTEICRKFTRASSAEMIAAAGLALGRWIVAPEDAFALVAAVRG